MRATFLQSHLSDTIHVKVIPSITLWASHEHQPTPPDDHQD